MKLKRLLASCFSLGKLPVAPGTWGSVPAVLAFSLLVHFGVSGPIIAAVMAVIVIAGSIVCLVCAPAVIRATGKTDPGEVVADELAGQAVAFLPAALLMTTTLTMKQCCVVAGIGFFAFRAFDIFKPWPVRRCEKLPGAWGILADDLAAGFFAAIVLSLFIVSGVPAPFAHAPAGSGPDGQMGLLSALILGAVQGATEFLPVSSSGHLVLGQSLFGFDPEQVEMLLFDLAAHVGTVLAILIVFRKSIWGFIGSLGSRGRPGGDRVADLRQVSMGRLALLVGAATVTTFLIVMALKDIFVGAFGSLLVVGLMWLVTGTLLARADAHRGPSFGFAQLGVGTAVIVGAAQAAAVLPGISRSGATVCAAILLGLNRRSAVEFSMLLAVPVILGAAGIEFVQNAAVFQLGNVSITAVLAGAAMATVVGIPALLLLLACSMAVKLRFFGYYCWYLGTAAVAWQLGRAFFGS